MESNSTYVGKEYKPKNDYENRFISDVINVYNNISERDIENQKEALRAVIKYIKKASKEGKTYEQIEKMVLYNISNLFEVVQYPNLSNFYQMRTLEYMMSADIEPYVHEILVNELDIDKFQKNYKVEYSANVKNNILFELCSMISDFSNLENNSTDSEYELLRQKIKQKSLTVDDEKLLSKYIKMYLDEIKIGKSIYWDEQKKDLEECRKLLLRYKDQIFDVETVQLGAQQLKRKSDDIVISDNAKQQGLADKIDAMKQLVNQKGGAYSIDAKSVKQDCSIPESYEKVTLKKFCKKPFISNSKMDNFLIVMNDSLRKMEQSFLEKMYKVIVLSESCPQPELREQCKDVVYGFFKLITYNKNLMHAKERLTERLCAIISFYKAAGILDNLCAINNSRLNRIYLGDLKVDSDTIYSKFINDGNFSEQYFIREEGEYEELYKGTPINFTSNEAIIGMSAFYTNRMAKQIPEFAKLRYILDKKDAVKTICENPDTELEDLDYTNEELATYMAMYKVMQDIMNRKYFNNTSEDQYLYEEKVYEELSKKLSKYKDVYEKYYPDLGFDYKKDITTIMMDAGFMSQLYELKEFSIKSLLYTAITDQKKNIINWGFVPEDDCLDEKFVLIGFDIKTLNSPIFVHIKKDELIQFLKELTGDYKIRVYEGSNNMYSYTIKQRVTTQVLYPLSKDEKKRLLKLEGKGILTDYYKHIKWLQQSSSLPILSHAPGSREYNLLTGEISKVKSQNQSQADEAKKSKVGSKKNSKNKGKKTNSSGFEDR